MSDFNRPEQSPGTPPPAPAVAARVGTPPLQRVGATPAPGTAQTTGGPNAANVELGAQFAEGSSSPAQKDRPIEGTKEAAVASQRAKYADLDAAALEAVRKQKIEAARLFSTAEVTKATADMDPAKAAEQRIKNARAILIELEATGMSPEEARAAAGMDERILKEVDRQQKMVDDLARSKAGLTDEQKAAAAFGAELREKAKSEKRPMTQGEHEELMKKLGGQEAVDKLPPETRLLLFGFTPDEIADHFTARDKDADVLVDPSDPENKNGKNTDYRGEGTLADTVKNGKVKSVKDGDRNDNAMNGDQGTVRRPMTPEEADLAIDMNAVLDQSWHAGNKFGKIVPENTVANYLSGTDTYRDDKGQAQGGRAIALTGDIGELANTAMTPERDGQPPTAAHQIQTAGLDYPGSPYVERDASGKLVPKAGPIHRVEGEITPDLEQKAEVQVGAGVMARAQQRSQELAEAQARHAAATGQTDAQLAADPNAPHVPKMLRRDSSEDQMPGLGMRNRESQIDPRTGLGFSTTESADMAVVPNQERKMSSAASFTPDMQAQVTRSDLPGQAIASFDPAQKKFESTAGLADSAKYDDLEKQSEERAKEVAAREAAKKAAEAAAKGGTS